MAIHDDYPRRTPYEIAFPEEDFREERFEAIRAEAEEREVEIFSPDAFMLLGAAGEAHRALAPPDADPETVGQYGALLFHGYHLWEAGARVHLLSTAVARFLAEAGPAADGVAGELPAAAGYVQLPRNLFWARVVEGGPAEPLDGFFWSAPGEEVHALLALGIRPDRPGLSVVPLPGGDREEVAGWAGVDAREGGSDFESTLPGGEIDELYSLETTGEALKLVARALGYLARFPDAVREVEAPAEAPGPGGTGEEAGAGPPVPSALPARRVTLK